MAASFINMHNIYFVTKLSGGIIINAPCLHSLVEKQYMACYKCEYIGLQATYIGI